MSEREGGPAFPPTHDPRTHDSGMTLRDYFAGQALAAAASASWSDKVAVDGNAETAAIWAYAYADAMMEARK